MAVQRRFLAVSLSLLAIGFYTLLRTDRNGWIELVTDGEQM